MTLPLFDAGCRILNHNFGGHMVTSSMFDLAMHGCSEYEQDQNLVTASLASASESYSELRRTMIKWGERFAILSRFLTYSPL